jgi:hypothetical protein
MTAAAVVRDWGPDVPRVETLEGLDRRWTRIDGIPFGATVDIEHVLLSTSGLAVVTTPGVVPASQQPISEARWRARKIEFLLAPVALVPVQPILVVPGVTTFGYGMRDGVLVATADDALCWLAHVEGDPVIPPAVIGELIDVIVRHTQRTELVNASFAY